MVVGNLWVNRRRFETVEVKQILLGKGGFFIDIFVDTDIEVGYSSINFKEIFMLVINDIFMEKECSRCKGGIFVPAAEELLGKQCFACNGAKTELTPAGEELMEFFERYKNRHERAFVRAAQLPTVKMKPSKEMLDCLQKQKQT